MTVYAPTIEELMAGTNAASARYEHILAIKEPWAREEAAREALLALAPMLSYHDVSLLANVIGEAGRFTGETYMEDQWRLIARHFPSLEPAILAVFEHVMDNRGDGDCSCPVGNRPAAAPTTGDLPDSQEARRG